MIGVVLSCGKEAANGNNNRLDSSSTLHSLRAVAGVEYLCLDRQPAQAGDYGAASIGAALPEVRGAEPTSGDGPAASVMAGDVDDGGRGEGVQYPPEIERLVCGYSWPCEEALAVMQCESTGDPSAYNMGNYGLFQINSVHAWRVNGDLESLFSAEVNVRVAFEIYLDNGGWSSWACKP